MAEFDDVCVVILAGGSGTRLWPLSRLQAPKQFLRLIGEESLLEATISRLRPLIPASQVVIVASEETARGEGFHALSPYKSILEPVGRNTAPAIAIAALRSRMAGEDPILVILPADHLIQDLAAFHAALRSAIAAAREGKLVMFGIVPTAPATGYGYIKAASGTPPLRVEAFKEKPDLRTAQAFLKEGGYYWNSGMFVWKASVFLEEARRTLPELARALDQLEAKARASGDFARAVAELLPSFPSISVDYGVLEKSANLHLIPASIGWSDVGSWDAVYDVAEKDAQHNALQGNVVAIDCENTLIRSGARLVAAVGVEGLAIIETPDAVLVTKRGETQEVRKIVEELARRSATEHIAHVTVQRPWGSFTVLEDGPGFKIKRIEVRPGGRLSMQRHERRSEHWVVIGGTATVTCDGRVSTCSVNESTFIPIGSIHRLENKGDVPLNIIEVQVGTYVGEDDIQRFEDQYGRATNQKS
jgi:mannose-1-phosphate guanylyltransferase/mannose-6-phosphate isomerase